LTIRTGMTVRNWKLPRGLLRRRYVLWVAIGQPVLAVEIGLLAYLVWHL
jgi:hypothetical protein